MTKKIQRNGSISSNVWKRNEKNFQTNTEMRALAVHVNRGELYASPVAKSQSLEVN